MESMAKPNPTPYPLMFFFDSDQAIEQTVHLLVIWDALMLTGYVRH